MFILFYFLKGNPEGKLIITVVLFAVVALIFLAPKGITGLAVGQLVNTTVGASPFYTTSSNPLNCGVMSDTNCETSWTVFATGSAGDYAFFVIYNSTDSNIAGANTNSVTISIGEPGVVSANDDYKGRGGKCSPTWDCTAWNACIDGQQARTCSDKWGCGVSDNKPTEIRPCAPAVQEEVEPVVEEPAVVEPVVEGPAPIEAPELKEPFDKLIIYNIIVILILFILAVVLFNKLTKKK